MEEQIQDLSDQVADLTSLLKLVLEKSNTTGFIEKPIELKVFCEMFNLKYRTVIMQKSKGTLPFPVHKVDKNHQFVYLSEYNAAISGDDKYKSAPISAPPTSK